MAVGTAFSTMLTIQSKAERTIASFLYSLASGHFTDFVDRHGMRTYLWLE